MLFAEEILFVLALAPKREGEAVGCPNGVVAVGVVEDVEGALPQEEDAGRCEPENSENPPGAGLD